ncbi:hypothetical protein OKW24_003168 [Peribacillus simplex]|nr:hypothetical protein [Peribacillus simplex]
MIKVDYITLTELQIKGRQAKQTSHVLANISSLFRSVKIQFYKDYISYYITLKNFFSYTCWYKEYCKNNNKYY